MLLNVYGNIQSTIISKNWELEYLIQHWIGFSALYNTLEEILIG